MENLMKITDAKLVLGDKRAKTIGGVYINYTSKDNVVNGSYIELNHEGSKHYFIVVNVEIEGDNLGVKAREVGYWGNKFDNKTNFDIRNLIGLPVSKVEDKQTESEIHEMSCWC